MSNHIIGLVYFTVLCALFALLFVDWRYVCNYNNDNNNDDINNGYAIV